MNKTKILLITFLLILCGFVIGVAIRYSFDGKEEKIYLSRVAPDNIYRTNEQTFVFENELRRDSRQEHIQTYLNKAVRSSVNLNDPEVIIDRACMTNPAVLKTSTSSVINFVNITDQREKLLIYDKVFILPASSSTRIAIHQISARAAASQGVSMIDYRCEGMTNKAGVLVITGK